MQIGPYRVLNEIARGGMGVVYKAQDASGRPVALKLLKGMRAVDPRARERFAREVDALLRLRHANVVALLGAGELDGVPWLALEFVAGESLEERLLRGPLTPKLSVSLTHQLAQALSYVHGCGLLHRDLKPANVLLQDERAMLTDFGLVFDSHDARSRLTASGVFHGTPGFWAPEQAQGRTTELGPATDVYGLGAVLYAALTARAPVQSETFAGYLEPEVYRRIPPPRALVPEVPLWLSQLCMRCLSEDPTERPTSADEVARALVAPHASREGGPRSRRAFGLAAGVVAALVTLATLAAWSLAAPPAQDEPPPAPALDPAQERLNEGEAALRAGQLEQALALYTHALEISPRSVPALQNRAALRLVLRDHQGALEDIDRAIALRPGVANFHAVRGHALVGLGRNLVGLSEYERGLALDPHDRGCLDSRATLLNGLGRYAEAEQAWTTVLELDPQSSNALYWRAFARSKLDLLEEALSDLERGQRLELDPEQRQAYDDLQEKIRRRRDAAPRPPPDDPRKIPRAAQDALDRGVRELRANRFLRAIEEFERAIELKPSFADAFQNRGLSYLSLGRHAEAIADFDEAIALFPDEFPCYLMRGRARQALGQLEGAFRDYERALELDPRSADAYAYRAWGYMLLERYEEAAADYERALTYCDPANRQALLQAKAQAERAAETATR